MSVTRIFDLNTVTEIRGQYKSIKYLKKLNMQFSELHTLPLTISINKCVA